MSTHMDLVNEANAIDHKYHEATRIVTKDFRRKFRLAAAARKAKDTATADRLAKEGKALSATLLKTTAQWQEAHQQLNALFLRDNIADSVVKALKDAANEAKGHLKAVKETATRLEALGKFAKFLEKTITTIAKLAG